MTRRNICDHVSQRRWLNYLDSVFVENKDTNHRKIYKRMYTKMLKEVIPLIISGKINVMVGNFLLGNNF